MKGYVMKRKIVGMFLISVVLVLNLNGSLEAEEKYVTDKDKVSYALGVNLVETIAPFSEEVALEPFVKGIRDQFSGKDLQMTDVQIQTQLTDFSKVMQKKMAAKNKIVGKKNAEEGMVFLKKNKDKKGVITTKSGLQYKVLSEGKGPIPKLTDTVKVHYKGTTISGDEFDSSYKRGQAATFPLTGVIKGWTEALQLMKVGSKSRLFVPPDLAYGPRGAGPKIGPNAVLIFEVELLGIE